MIILKMVYRYLAYLILNTAVSAFSSVSEENMWYDQGYDARFSQMNDTK